MRIALTELDCFDSKVKKHILRFAPNDKILRGFVEKQKPGTKPGFFVVAVVLRAQRASARSGQLLGGHLFGFAFLAHHFELAFRGFEFCVDFLLDALCRFFQFW